MSLPSRQIFAVRHDSDVAAARREATALSASLGFERKACEEIGLVTTELATNLLKHAKGGTLALTPLSAQPQVGLQIESHDTGPGIADINEVLADRVSTAGTRGTGLGAINRLTDQLEISSHLGQGTHVLCRKWLRAHRVSPRKCPLEIGVATRPRQLGQPNGDAFVVKHWAENVLVGVIDGLGHGEFAHVAADAARLYVEAHYDRPLEEIFQGTARACQNTRGVVMALARFDWGEGNVSVASIGNIEPRVFPAAEAFHFRTRRGVIGLNAPEPLVTRRSWPPAMEARGSVRTAFNSPPVLPSPSSESFTNPPHPLFILHSDGLGTHWSQGQVELSDQPATVLARELLRKLAKPYDDATVIVVKDLSA